MFPKTDMAKNENLLSISPPTKNEKMLKYFLNVSGHSEHFLKTC